MTMKAGENPADHNADDVTAYLAGLTDPAEFQRVIQAEQGDGGKARKTVLEFPDPTVPDPEAHAGPDDGPDEDGYTRKPVNGYPEAEPAPVREGVQ
jgi:hypothetical protein